MIGTNTLNKLFWQEYTDRNLMTTKDADAMYMGRYGFSRSEMNKEFLGGMDRNIDILEVGCGAGLQLQFLKDMGFINLYGVDSSQYAVNMARENGFDVFLEDANALPFDDNSFDLAFTSGLLIHIPLDALRAVIGEIIRCSKKWIWGLEYYAPQLTAIKYRGHTDLLWKADYSHLFTSGFDDLVITKERLFPYLIGGNTDSMFLLEKVYA